MRINFCDLEIGDDGLIKLVKEKGVNYQIDMCNSPEKMTGLVNNLLNANKKATEHMYLICFNNALLPIAIFTISIGTDVRTIIDMKGIFQRILLSGGNHFALIHNHPSGNNKPSADDISTCQQVFDCSKLLGIRMLDFLIVAKEKYYSFSNEDLVLE